MNLKLVLAAGTVALALASIAPAHAAVLFNNDLFNSPYTGNNPEAQGQYVAQDFVLAQNSTLNSFFYNAFTNGNTVPVTSVNVNIYTDNANTVGSMIFSGSFNVASQVNTGNYSSYTLVDFGVNLPSWTLSAGSYFVALNVLPAQWDMHWSVPNNPTLPGNNYISSTGLPGTFSSYSFDQTFRFEGTSNTVAETPLPAALPLFAGGLGVMGLLARRRKRKNGALAAA